MIRVVARKSRRSRWCDDTSAHQRRIEPGDWYGRVSVSPKDEIMGAADGKWYSYPICLPCLLETRTGRISYYSRDREGRKLVEGILQRRADRLAAAAV
ncbi:hypothetical protein FDH48_gp47 [Arthrobacter phage Jawnski]|uniref:Uncharacterized protein n=3 Tax=Jawnskivirus TaxID=3425003 RepID=A0A222Z291_9CAUD|nr:hypothetical protein FDH47_gp48 [Arthrobacter phage Brent]YP_009601607.1 hypothetical protein FDH48_gp47 [Arthrobacter phage Jawnski]ALF01259.1 hypothetical protein SEA_BRENT_48 [Arthrobacter phage Brent]ALY09376.1 hypothetical protein JAWNSKI_47 [Arthrobacter phage Jawnski]ASR78150.1 hypothetical protein SEA_FRANZY_48 [Arthrobacter phage Franzy]